MTCIPKASGGENQGWVYLRACSRWELASNYEIMQLCNNNEHHYDSLGRGFCTLGICVLFCFSLLLLLDFSPHLAPVSSFRLFLVLYLSIHSTSHSFLLLYLFALFLLPSLFSLLLLIFYFHALSFL